MAPEDPETTGLFAKLAAGALALASLLAGGLVYLVKHRRAEDRPRRDTPARGVVLSPTAVHVTREELDHMADRIGGQVDALGERLADAIAHEGRRVDDRLDGVGRELGLQRDAKHALAGEVAKLSAVIHLRGLDKPDGPTRRRRFDAPSGPRAS